MWRLRNSVLAADYDWRAFAIRSGPAVLAAGAASDRARLPRSARPSPGAAPPRPAARRSTSAAARADHRGPARRAGWTSSRSKLRWLASATPSALRERRPAAARRRERRRAHPLGVLEHVTNPPITSPRRRAWSGPAARSSWARRTTGAAVADPRVGVRQAPAGRVRPRARDRLTRAGLERLLPSTLRRLDLRYVGFCEMIFKARKADVIRLGVDGRELQAGGPHRYRPVPARGAPRRVRAGWSCVVYGDRRRGCPSRCRGGAHDLGRLDVWWDQVPSRWRSARPRRRVPSPYYKLPLVSRCPRSSRSRPVLHRLPRRPRPVYDR